jgi:NAD+ kinase
MKVAIYGRAISDKYLERIKNIFDALKQAGVEFFVYEHFNTYLITKNIHIDINLKTFTHHTEIAGKVDVMLSIGGDGTLLDTLKFVRDDIPVLGINTGRLGFLSGVSMDETQGAIAALLDKKYTLDKRNTLKLQTKNNMFGDTNYALNELTVHKKDSASMMIIHAYLDGSFLNTYWADGLIVSTPTGSTAYSLSCGGPIIIPGSENFIITPIAPHNLNVRPVVVPSNCEIKLKLEGRSKKYLVSLDSRTETIDPSIELIIKKGDFKINLVRLENQDFLSTLRNKLMWGLDLRN